MSGPHRLAIASRRQFLDWLSEDIELQTRGYYSDSGLDELLGSENIALIWKDFAQGPNAYLRPVIVVDDAAIRDFLAWTSVYVASFAPFTAFFRVLTRSQFTERSNEKNEPHFDRSLLQALAGVVIAETVVQMAHTPRALSTVSIQACEGTFSYAALGALNSGMHPADLSELASAWTTARSIGSNASLRLDPEDTSTFWMIVSHVLSTGDATAEQAVSWTGALHDLIVSARYDRPIDASLAWTFIRQEVPTISSKTLDFSLPREDQLKSLDEAALVLEASSIPRPLAEAWLGMLTSRLANGSFDYIGVLDSVRDKLPASLLWFAFFSVWRPGYDGLIAGNCLGRRIAREAMDTADLFDAPRYDATLLEYEVLADSASTDRLRSDATSVVALEVRPFVIAKFRAASRGARDDSSEPASINTVRLRKALTEALSALEPEPRNTTYYTPRSAELFDSSPQRRPATKGKKKQQP